LTGRIAKNRSIEAKGNVPPRLPVIVFIINPPNKNKYKGGFKIKYRNKI
jgi:hypothetical protein